MKAQMRHNTQSVREAGDALAGKLNDWFSEFGPGAVFKSCANCKHMDPDAPPLCKRYGMTPPAKVIVVGCEQHEDSEEIPF